VGGLNLQAGIEEGEGEGRGEGGLLMMAFSPTNRNKMLTYTKKGDGGGGGRMENLTLKKRRSSQADAHGRAARQMREAQLKGRGREGKEREGFSTPKPTKDTNRWWQKKAKRCWLRTSKDDQ